MRGISGSRGDERGHGTRFRDALFEDLSIFRFFVIEQRVDVDRFVFLANARIDSRSAEERFHAESSRFVRNDGHNELANLGILEHLAQHAHERHGGGYFPALAAFQEFLEEIVVLRRNWF